MRQGMDEIEETVYLQIKLQILDFCQTIYR